MKATSVESIENTQVAKLFRNTLIITLAHVLAAAFLVYVTAGQVNDKFITHWFALLTISILVSLLGLSFFRRREPELEALRKWESIFANTSLCTGLVFAVAYSFVIHNNPENLIPTVCFIVAMHISSIVVPCFGSRRGALSQALPIIIPVVGMLAYLQTPTGYKFAIALGLYGALFLYIGLSFHVALKQNMVLKDKFKHEVKLNQRYKNKIDSLTIEDSLTHIYNRKFFELMINHETRRAKRVRADLSIAILEIDSYAEYKENYGEENSDKLLIVVAKQLSNAMARGGEFVARYSENQFVLLLPHVNAELASPFVKKMMNTIDDMEIEHEFSSVVDYDTITISGGIAELDHTRIIDTSEINKHANLALKEAKISGGHSFAVYCPNTIKRLQAIKKDDSSVVSLATEKGKNIA